MKTLELEIEFLDYWHCGSGRGRGKLLDAVIDRDDSDLPFVPGRTLKGLLRDAVLALEALGDAAAPPGTCATLFGHVGHAGSNGSATPDTNEPTPRPSRHESQPGLLAVSDARLPPELRRWLADPAQSRARAELCTTLFSTAIDTDGVAREHSLRAIEVALPLQLSAHLSLHSSSFSNSLSTTSPTGPAMGDWVALIRRATQGLRSIGSNRSRGLGRCRIRTLEEPR